MDGLRVIELFAGVGAQKQYLKAYELLQGIYFLLYKTVGLSMIVYTFS